MICSGQVIGLSSKGGLVGIAERVQGPEVRPPGWTISSVLADTGLVLLLIVAVPIVIIVLGSPVALFARLLSEIAKRL